MDRPWNGYVDGIDGSPPGMLGPKEAALLYHLSRDYYNGHGEIIDAGAFLGGSAYSLAKGLEENLRVPSKSGRIHSYDLFQIWAEPGVDQNVMSAFLKRTYGIDTAQNESTFHIFSANLGQLARHVRIHQGDILDQAWSGRPIEILFIDICKTLPIWKHVIKTFYRSLIPGISTVVHQDWHHPSLPYLHVAQEYLSPYFDVFELKADDSVAFKLKDKIPDSVIDTAASFDFSAGQQINLIDSAIERFSGHARFLKLSKAEMLRRQGRARDAIKLVEDTYDFNDEHMSDSERHYFYSNIDGVAMACSRDLASAVSQGGFNEEEYIAAHPQVAVLVKQGAFVNAYHHYIRFNVRSYLERNV